LKNSRKTECYKQTQANFDMRKIPITAYEKIKKAIPKIKSRLDIHTDLKKNYIIINGQEYNEVMTEKIILALDFGFEIDDALILLKDDWDIEYVNIKEHTHRKNLEEIRSRVIGTDGKAKRTIENLTGSSLVVHGNMVGIISDAEHMPYTIQGIVSLVQGAKHGNVFAYIEKQNANLRKIDAEDLGLRDPEKDLENLD
jgi:KH domain-containing protein